MMDGFKGSTKSWDSVDTEQEERIEEMCVERITTVKRERGEGRGEGERKHLGSLW